MPKGLPNLVVIEGPNSSGKSTLLNIFSLALFGMKSRKMDPILVSRMKTLLDFNHQKITFNFEISSEDEALILKSRKSHPTRTEIILEESIDGKSFKPISYETFERKYNLVYDIPNNPTERLYELTKELKEDQQRCGNRFKEFSWFLRSTIKEISQSRDPNRLKEIKNKLKQVSEKRKKIVDQLPGLLNFLDSLEKHGYVKFYYYYENECYRLKEAKDRIQKRSDEFTQTGRKLSKKLRALKTEISSLQGEVSTNFNKATPLINDLISKKERHRFKIWKDINPYDTNVDLLNRIQVEVVHYLNLFWSQLEKMNSDDAFLDASLLQKIIDSLKEFEDSPFKNSKIETAFNGLINMLREENKKNFLLISRYQNLEKVKICLDTLKDSATILLAKLGEVRETSATETELTDDYSESIYEWISQLRKLDEELKRAMQKRDDYFHKSLSKKIDKRSLEKSSFKEMVQQLPENEEMQPFLSLNEKQFETRLLELEEETGKKRREIQSLDVYIDEYKKEKKRLEGQKPHKYEGHQAQLQSLLQKTESISQKLLDRYSNYIKSLVDGKVKQTDVDQDESKRKYFSEVSRYLAHRISVFKHIAKTYKAKAVDLISGVIITDDNLTIYLSDMGTGQSQSAYLLGLLNIKDDNRKIIALFDEIAMMDDSSLEPVYEKMRELYKRKRLLVGILVQKGNEMKIKSLEDV